MTNTIGVLAGMGPFSTAPFIHELMMQCRQLDHIKSDKDFPPVMIYSLPVPFRQDRELEHQLIEKTIISGLQKLENCGVNFIAMPCNTAHLYYNNLQSSINIPLLNMMEETIHRLPPGNRSTILATSFIMDANLYQKGLLQKGTPFMFNQEWQLIVNEIIRFVKMGKGAAEGKDKWNVLVEKLEKSGIEQIVLACTDLNPAIANIPKGIKLLDAGKCLARATVREYLKSVKRDRKRIFHKIVQCFS